MYKIHLNLRLLLAVFVTLLLTPTPLDGACNSCMPNAVACLNSTAFHMCHDGVLDETIIFNCPENYVCTQLGLICVEQGQFPPACNLNVVCGQCDGDKPFVCISRTQYAQCYGTQLTENIGNCPSGKVCNTTGSQICVDACDEPECDRATPA